MHKKIITNDFWDFFNIVSKVYEKGHNQIVRFYNQEKLLNVTFGQDLQPEILSTEKNDEKREWTSL